jgi:hypothetical protein
VTSCCTARPGALLWLLRAAPDSPAMTTASISWQAASACDESASGSAHRTVRHGGLRAVLHCLGGLETCTQLAARTRLSVPVHWADPEPGPPRVVTTEGITESTLTRSLLLIQQNISPDMGLTLQRLPPAAPGEQAGRAAAWQSKPPCCTRPLQLRCWRPHGPGACARASGRLSWRWCPGPARPPSSHVPPPLPPACRQIMCDPTLHRRCTSLRMHARPWSE